MSHFTPSQQHTLAPVVQRHIDRPAEYPGLYTLARLAARLGLRESIDYAALEPQQVPLLSEIQGERES